MPAGAYGKTPKMSKAPSKSKKGNLKLKKANSKSKGY